MLVPARGEKGKELGRGGARRMNVAIGNRRLGVGFGIDRRTRCYLLAKLDVHGVSSLVTNAFRRG